MKIFLAILLTLALALSLCACTTGQDPTDPDDQPQPSGEVTPTGDTPADNAPAGGESIDSAQLQALCDTLAFMNENTLMGVSGSSLRAIQSAGTLLDWAAATTLTADQIKQGVAAWLSDMGNDEQVSFAEKLETVNQSVSDLQGDNAEDMLSTAGYAPIAYPWSDTALNNAAAVMEAAGLQ